MTANTAGAIITKAYQDAQKLQLGATLSTAQLSAGLDRLNDMINLWQTQGLKLWLETEQVVPLVVGQQLYSFFPTGDIAIARPLRVKEASYWTDQNVSRPIWPISRQEWTALSNRTEQGSINQYFIEKLADRMNMYIWNSPDTSAATGTIHAVLQNQATNPTLSGDDTGFPIEWVAALRWGLADELTSGMPEATVQRCQARAAAYREALEGWDVEDAETYFQPDIRSTMWNGGRFR